MGDEAVEPEAQSQPAVLAQAVRRPQPRSPPVCPPACPQHILTAPEVSTLMAAAHRPNFVLQVCERN